MNSRSSVSSESFLSKLLLKIRGGVRALRRCAASPSPKRSRSYRRRPSTLHRLPRAFFRRWHCPTRAQTPQLLHLRPRPGGGGTAAGTGRPRGAWAGPTTAGAPRGSPRGGKVPPGRGDFPQPPLLGRRAPRLSQRGASASKDRAPPFPRGGTWPVPLPPSPPRCTRSPRSGPSFSADPAPPRSPRT